MTGRLYVMAIRRWTWGRIAIRRWTRRRLTIALVVLSALALTILVTSRTQLSDATWTDTEYGRGTFTATVLAKPEMLNCVLSPGLLGTAPVVTIQWSFPAGFGYTLATNIQYFTARSGLLANLTQILPGAQLTTTGPAVWNGNPNVYTTVFGSALLNGLLGGTYSVILRVTANGWISADETANASMGLAGINPTCTIAP